MKIPDPSHHSCGVISLHCLRQFFDLTKGRVRVGSVSAEVFGYAEISKANPHS